MTWNEFVKKVQKEQGISYKLALKAASPLWAKHKEKQGVKPRKKKRRKKKVVEMPVEVTDFPKVQTKKKQGSQQKIAKTQSRVVNDLGGNIGNELTRRREKLKGRKRIQKKHSILLDSAFKYTARKSKIRI
jgi:hypothetical protein